MSVVICGLPPGCGQGCNQCMFRAWLFLIILIPSILGAEKETTGVTVGLVSEVGTIAAGEPFTLGVRIEHDEHFHTYWRNPGVVGMATAIDWDLPEGFVAGPIQWPFPERVDMAGHPAHGYERDVLLLVEITPPELIGEGEATIVAKIRWMACADGCYPGRAERSVQLKVGEETVVDPAKVELFDKARKEGQAGRSEWKVLLAPESKGEDFVISIKSGGSSVRRPRDAYFFSSDGLVSSVPKQTLEMDESGGYRLRLKRSKYPPEKATALAGLLEIDGEWVKVALPLEGPGG